MTTFRRRWWTSVAAQVWGMVLTCASLVAFLIVVDTRHDVSEQRARVSESLLSTGTSLRDLLIVDLEPGGETEATLAELADQDVLKQGGAACDAALGTIQRAVETGYILGVAATGTVTCSASPAYARRGSAVLAGVPGLRAAVASGKGAVSDPFRDPVTAELSLFTLTPLTAAPRTALVYVYDTQTVFEPLDRDTSTSSLLVHLPSRQLVMHYPAQQGVVGTRTEDSGLADVLTSTGGVRAATGPDGVRRLYRAIPFPDLPYTLLVGVSEHEALAPARASLRRNLLIGVSLLAVMGALGLLLQRRIARPARRLRAAITALADDPEAPDAPVSGPNELAAVAAAFNETAAARRRSDGLSRAILQHASDLVVVVDAQGGLAYVAPTAREELGLVEGQETGALLDLVHRDDRERVVSTVREWLAEGSRDLALELRVHPDPDGTRTLDVRAQDLRHDRYVRGVVLTARDVTERRAFEAHLEHQARHDPLTGLANRAGVIDRLAADIADGEQAPACVFYVDLDRFKLVNDSHGHAVGDQVLIALADELRDLTQPGDLVGRFGGDEFVIVTDRIRTPLQAEVLAAQVRRALEEPLQVGRRELFVSGSVGIAMAELGDSPEDVLRNADTAMYRAKARGRACSAFFDTAMRAEAQRLLRTESDLHRALERQQLALHFQPVLDVRSGQFVGAEALVRWNHPSHGLVAPADFIPVAEETGLVVPIGEWVLRTAAAWAVESARRLGRPIVVSVNVSPRQLSQPDVVELVADVLARTGLSPSCLCLEVTESVLVQDAESATRVLNALHDKGVRLSIDDFGTGWSSLTYLQQFPVDEIKLDRSYVGKVDRDESSASIVGALVGMAHSLGLTVTAEGVETLAQLDFLRSHGCDSAQGYYFSRAVPPAEALELLRRPAVPLQRPHAVGEPVG